MTNPNPKGIRGRPVTTEAAAARLVAGLLAVSDSGSYAGVAAAIDGHALNDELRTVIEKLARELSKR